MSERQARVPQSKQTRFRKDRAIRFRAMAREFPLLICPTGKNVYEKKTRARRHLSELRADERLAGFPERAELLHIYRCPRCHWFHVGHSSVPRDTGMAS